MPKAYEAIRDKLAKDMPLAEAKTRAAKIFNSQRKPGVAPVTGHSEGEKKKRPGVRKK